LRPALIHRSDSAAAVSTSSADEKGGRNGKGPEQAFGLTMSSGETFGQLARNAVWLDEKQTSAFDLWQVSLYLRLLPWSVALTSRATVLLLPTGPGHRVVLPDVHFFPLEAIRMPEHQHVGAPRRGRRSACSYMRRRWLFRTSWIVHHHQRPQLAHHRFMACPLFHERGARHKPLEVVRHSPPRLLVAPGPKARVPGDL
jgi:hypothetical protein